MTTYRHRNGSRRRIHAIVLTRNRPETLRRCLAATASSLGTEDTLTILDDSAAPAASSNVALLATTVTPSGPTCVHLPTYRIREMAVRSLPAAHLLWLASTASRDIAPQRNLSLFLSVAVPADTTVLIDDDVYGFDLSATHEKTRQCATDGCGVIAGASVAGINENDTITRLADALDVLHTCSAPERVRSPKELFQVASGAPPDLGTASKYVSAGYMAFQLGREKLFAFPPGYNEDWLWCLLYERDAQVRVCRSGEAVIHDPPSVREPSREDLIFELVGELVLDCLETSNAAGDVAPEGLLDGLTRIFPCPDSMPDVRAAELIDKAASFEHRGGPFRMVEQHGLAVLADMLRTGELMMDGRRVLSGWANDALAKHRSFANALEGDDTMPVVRSLLQEGAL